MVTYLRDYLHLRAQLRKHISNLDSVECRKNGITKTVVATFVFTHVLAWLYVHLSEWETRIASPYRPIRQQESGG
ncbi:hypothetical protein D8Y22_15485 [Salinadaptatus halalkaliphilus]|uniref:Uncharacterized protein n=1 Tax=Salinadaptatus halalkaliphilus TaxID=2419781 RepID=A0A4V6RUC3_9EURY|nr:hypothetical protein D8Y22_15485 [Salinadaptatus halalkaliphilus]